MDSCLGVEQDLDKATTKFTTLNDQTSTAIDELITKVENLKKELAKQSADDPLPPEEVKLIVDMIGSLKQAVFQMSTDHRELHATVSRVGKSIDRHFIADYAAVAPKAESFCSDTNRPLMEQAIAQHLYRQGLEDVGDAFIAEARIPPVERTCAFAQLQRCAAALAEGDPQPALEWVEERAEDLTHSPLPFTLHRMKALKLGREVGVGAAIGYARAVFPAHAARHERALRACVCALAWCTPAAPPPPPHYRRLLDPKALGAEAAEVFIRESCALLRLAPLSPLAGAVLAGARVLPALHDIRAKMAHPHVIAAWADDELPLEVDLGEEGGNYHSVFACPILRQQASDANPPMRLLCGHVISRDALNKLTMGVKLALLAARKYESEKKPEEEHELALAPPTTSDFTHTENSISDGNISLQSNVQDEDSDSSILVETGNASSLKEFVDVIDTIVGNRIINFRYFWKQIMTIAEHGEKFNCKLNYLKIVKEKQIGLVSTFELKCALCRSKFVIKTEETQQSNFDLNAKTVSGTIMVGIGLSNLNELIASMDLPTLSFRLYSKVHDSVSDMWKAAAEETMLNAAKDEIEAAKLRGDVSKAGIAMIAVEADACWSKRSYKNNYSALSGVATIIGEYTGKVLHIGVRNKFCMICTRASKKEETPRTHKCTKNHSGSSTSMEQTILVEGFKKSINEKSLIYKTLIADGDSSTYKSILESRPYADVPIQKIECTNHLLRNYNGKNLLLQKDTTVPLAERKLLTNDRLTRLRTAVRSAIKFRKDENKNIDNKIESLQKDIINSPRHIFGDHTQCDDYYCTEERKNEPNLVPQAQTLMLKLQRNASQLAFNSRSLLHCFTNNRAEQFNSIVAKMVGGKRVNFSIKDSYTTRCYAAVVAFNTGKPQYVLYKSAINKSPGKSLKRLEARRNAKNCREVKARAKMSRKKLHYAKVDKDYGVACERPDMSDEDFEGAKKAFLDNLKEQASNRHQIERSTILQAESSLWLELRRCLLTASTFGKICKRRPNQNSAPLVKALLYSYDLSNIASVKHGKENEEKALLQLSVQENIHINKCGLFIHKDYCFLGATPDGVFDNGIVEIKCPSSAFGVDPETALKQKKLKCFKLNEKNEYILNPNNDWFYQVQGQLNVADKHVCLFAVWTGAEFPLKVVRVYRDEEFWRQKMLPKLIQFYDKCILPELIDPRKARSMQLREIFL